MIIQDGIYKWLLSTFFVWLLLAIYFDNIFPNSSGVRKSLFYFLKPSYWMGEGGNNGEGICISGILLLPSMCSPSWQELSLTPFS